MTSLHGLARCMGCYAITGLSISDRGWCWKSSHAAFDAETQTKWLAKSQPNHHSHLDTSSQSISLYIKVLFEKGKLKEMTFRTNLAHNNVCHCYLSPCRTNNKPCRTNNTKWPVCLLSQAIRFIDSDIWHLDGDKIFKCDTQPWISSGKLFLACREHAPATLRRNWKPTSLAYSLCFWRLATESKRTRLD
jgi:hypothetical protein